MVACLPMESLPLFPDFIELGFPHQHLIREILQAKGIHSSDFGFYNLMGWYFRRPAYISRLQNTLILRLDGPKDSTVFLPPLGVKSIASPLKTLLEYLPQAGFPPEVHYVPLITQKEILTHFPLAQSLPQRGDFDYLYSRKELAELAGRKFHQKKNFVNRVNEEESPTIELLAPHNLEEGKQFLSAWYKDFAATDDNVEIEALAAERMLPHIEEIGGLGILIRISSKVAGISVASPINRECWVVSLEKAEKSKKGLYQFVNWALANRLPPEVTLLNRETDLGIEGLRNAKLSYHPVGFEEKFSIRFPQA